MGEEGIGERKERREIGEKVRSRGEKEETRNRKGEEERGEEGVEAGEYIKEMMAINN